MKNHQKLLDIPSAWIGLEHVANWIVETVRPHVTVDLGVDHGFSTCVLATAGYGKVYGIDRRADILAKAQAYADTLGLKNIELICDDYNLVALGWERPVDILHIDGDHDYESVVRDFASWQGHLRPGGILLMHDLDSFPDGPGRVFNTIEWPKWVLRDHHGLGVLTKPYA